MFNNNKEFRNLKYVAKKLIRRPIFRKIREIEDKFEQKILLEYCIKSNLNMEYSNLHDQINKAKKEGKDVFPVSTKLHLLKSKIHVLQVDFNKKEFKNFKKLLKQIKKGLKNA